MLLPPDPCDSTDEQCANGRCNRGYWQCNNGRCIPNKRLCNGDNDCTDGSDEDTNTPGMMVMLSE